MEWTAACGQNTGFTGSKGDYVVLAKYVWKNLKGLQNVHPRVLYE